MRRAYPDHAVAEDALPRWCGRRHQIPRDFVRHVVILLRAVITKTPRGRAVDWAADGHGPRRRMANRRVIASLGIDGDRHDFELWRN
jgi:hypothetical protein